MKEKHTINVNLSSGYRYDRMEGRDYLVVPAVMIKQGILNGSQGPVFYSGDALSEDVYSWNSRPVVVYHPQVNGEFVSASADPNLVTAHKVGLLMNTEFKDNSLQSECWLETDRLQMVDNRVLEAILANKPLSVSVGVFSDSVQEQGVYEGEDYTVVANNLRPDHLAILPDQVGACSLEKGCGLLVNSEQQESYHRQQYLATLAKMEEKRKLVVNEMSFSDVSYKLYRMLGETYGEKGRSWDGYVDEVFSDFCIYSSDGNMYKQSYTVKKDMIHLTGKPVQVKTVVQYEPIVNQIKEVSMTKQEKVDALIANTSVKWEAGDKDFLLSLEDAQLDKMVPEEEAKVVTANTDCGCKKQEPVVNVAPPAEKKVMTFQEMLSQAPAEYQDIFKEGMEARNRNRAELIANIKKNPANIFTDDMLNDKPTHELNALSALAGSGQERTTPLYIGQNSDLVANSAQEDLIPLGLPKWDDKVA
jgi:hypothetical protein